MSIRVLIDMNLSPDWAPFLQRHGWEAVHWSAVGDPRAPDREIMAWALAQQYVVFTHDLDFGTTLALTHAAGPSVLQIRGQDVLPDRMGLLVIAAPAATRVRFDCGCVGRDRRKPMSRSSATILG